MSKSKLSLPALRQPWQPLDLLNVLYVIGNRAHVTEKYVFIYENALFEVEMSVI